MEWLQIVGAIVGLVANIPLFIGIYKNEVKQNFVSWILFFLLDVIAVTSIVLQDGNYALPLAYTIGSLSIACLLLVKRQLMWSWIEALVLIFVTICLIVWWILGVRATNIASVIAIFIASVPVIKDTILKPSLSPTGVWFAFAFGGLLSLLGSKDWSVEQSLYPAATFGFSSLIAILSMRKDPGPKL